MSTIDNSNPFAAISGSDTAKTPRATGAAAKALGQDQFLELMVAQLKNQDPTKPMDNSQFLGQIAQFGTVSGIQDLQKSFTEMAGALQSNQALMASGLVGRSVMVPGGAGLLPTGGALTGSVNLPMGVSDLAVSITDDSGQLVRRLVLGGQQAGDVRFSWDGLNDAGASAAPGRYQVTAEALVDGKTYAADTSISALVESVSLGGAQGMLLNLTGLGSVSLGDVKQIS
jgi:flagellar basal-body rod modification protein FlgD